MSPRCNHFPGQTECLWCSIMKPCPFCGGRCDRKGWARSDGSRGPECEGCGATAVDVYSWNFRVEPVEESEEQRAGLRSSVVAAQNRLQKEQRCTMTDPARYDGRVPEPPYMTEKERFDIQLAEAARLLERTVIVEWLRQQAKNARKADEFAYYADRYASEIELGEHLR